MCMRCACMCVCLRVCVHVCAHVCESVHLRSMLGVLLDHSPRCLLYAACLTSHFALQILSLPSECCNYRWEPHPPGRGSERWSSRTSKHSGTHWTISAVLVVFLLSKNHMRLLVPHNVLKYACNMDLLT